MAVPVAASTPSLIWQDVARVGVQCVVASDRVGEQDRVADALCGRVRVLAAAGAPVPVLRTAVGDPAVLAQRQVTLLVHASVQPLGDRRLLAFTVRPFRVSGDQNTALFGAAPRAVLLPTSGAVDATLDPALSAALADTLPWRARPRTARPISTRD